MTDLHWDGEYLVGARHPQARVSANFLYREFDPDGHGTRVHRSLITGLQDLRALLGTPLGIEPHPHVAPPHCRPLNGSLSSHNAGDAIHLRTSHDAVRIVGDLALFGRSNGVQARGPFHEFSLQAGTRNGGGYVHLQRRASDGYTPRSWASFVNGRLWLHLWAALGPTEYRLFKRNGGHAYSRQWAREEAINMVARVARAYMQQTGSRLGIGDLSHVLGGQMTDHSSHRNGTDIDLYVLLEDGSDNPIHYTCGRPGAADGYFLTSTGQPAEPGVEAELKERTRILCALLAEEPLVATAVGHDHEVFRQFVIAGKDFRDRTGTCEDCAWPPHRDHIHVRIAS